jgi:acylphosphatase
VTVVPDRRARRTVVGMIRRHVVVHGWVQGVGFRFWCEYRARELGVRGWVRNLDDGDVEAVFEGDDEAVTRMLGWVRVGPKHATVSSIDVREETPRAEAGFDIRY